MRCQPRRTESTRRRHSPAASLANFGKSMRRCPCHRWRCSPVQTTSPRRHPTSGGTGRRVSQSQTLPENTACHTPSDVNTPALALANSYWESLVPKIKPRPLGIRLLCLSARVLLEKETPHHYGGKEARPKENIAAHPARKHDDGTLWLSADGGRLGGNCGGKAGGVLMCRMLQSNNDLREQILAPRGPDSGGLPSQDTGGFSKTGSLPKSPP